MDNWYVVKNLSTDELDEMAREIEYLYLSSNLTKQEVADELQVEFNVVRNMLSRYDIKKSEGSIQKSRARRIQESVLDKYGVSNVMKVPEIASKSRRRQRSIMLEKYGVTSNLNLESVREKQIESTKTRKITSEEVSRAKESRKATFRRRYGVDSVYEYSGTVKRSDAEDDLSKILTSWGISHTCNDRSVIRNPDTDYPLELDIYIKDNDLAIEYNSRRYHSESDHTDLKVTLCESLGIELLILSESDDYYEFIELLKIKLGINYSVVESVEVLEVEDFPVYDIEVPDHHNFVLDNGLIVHNSVDTLQQFRLQGYNAEEVSVDRTTKPYVTLKNAYNEGRIIAPENRLLEDELFELEDDRSRGKIDHPSDGSKDIADTIAACVYKASIYEGAFVNRSKVPPSPDNIVGDYSGVQDDIDELLDGII